MRAEPNSLQLPFLILGKNHGRYAQYCLKVGRLGCRFATLRKENTSPTQQENVSNSEAAKGGVFHTQRMRHYKKWAQA
jgi:hypothetical protein